MNMTNKLKIVAFAPNSWDGPWMNRQQILSRLANKHFVLYTTGLWATWDIKNGRASSSPWLGKVENSNSVWVDHPPRLLFTNPRFPNFCKITTRLGNIRLRSLLPFNRRWPLVAYVFHPNYWPYIDKLGADFIVYHIYDAYNLQKGWCDKLSYAHNCLVEKSDLILASSDMMAKSLKIEERKKRHVVVNNGCDYESFVSVDNDKYILPEDMKDIHSPRIGYVGNINVKLDLNLILHLSTKNKEWQFVFVGGVNCDDINFLEKIEILKSFDNVHFLGHKVFTELPKYTFGMDVNIMPYCMERSVWSYSCSPLKLNEYLASGKPVVSSNISSVQNLSDVVWIANGPKDWEYSIKKAIKSKDELEKEKRRNIARINSWDIIVGQIEDELNSLVTTQKTHKRK